MSRFFRGILVLATASIAGTAVASFALASSEPNPPPAIVSISPADLVPQPGEPLLFDVTVSGVPSKPIHHPDEPGGLGAFEFTLPFSPSIMALQDVTVGPFLGSNGRTVTCLPPALENGSVRFGCVTDGSGAGPSGNGVLAHLQFSVFCPANADLNLSNVNLAEPLGKSIPASGQGAQLSCDPALPTQTPTPSPTRTPTPLEKALGDVNDDLEVNSVDALLILQFEAGLLGSLINPSSADLNDDSHINPIDAALILQCEVALIDICH